MPTLRRRADERLARERLAVLARPLRAARPSEPGGKARRPARAAAAQPRRFRCANGSASSAASRRACSASIARWSGSSVALLALGLVMVYSASVAMPDNPKFARYTPTYFLVAPRDVHGDRDGRRAGHGAGAGLVLGEALALDLRRRAAAARDRAGAVHRQGRQRRAPLDPARHHELPAVGAHQAGDRDVRRRLHGARAWT